MPRLGCLWGLLGLVTLFGGILSWLANRDLGQWIGSWPSGPGMVKVLQLMYFPQVHYLLIALGALWLILVWGLLERKSWARVLSIGVCYLSMAYVVAGFIIALALPPLFPDQPWWFAGITAGLLAALGASAVNLSSRASVKAFALGPTGEKCPKCGSALDQEGKCPRCQGEGKATSAWLQTAEGTPIPLKGHRVTIGRGKDSTIKVNDPSVSHRHAEVVYRDGGWFIVDLESTNGVVVNGSRVKEAGLKDGDEVLLGRNKFVFKTKKG